MTDAGRTFIDALNRNLTDADALAGQMPANLRSAADVYSQSQIDAQVADLEEAIDAKEPTIAAGTTGQYWRGDKSWQTLNKSAVGLGNVDNTSDAAKPVSTATQAALDEKLTTAEIGAALLAYYQSLTSSTTGVSMSPGLNTAGSAVVKVNPGVLNVKDFGAVGNGVANDSTAIQAAIAAADAAGGATLVFPDGVYLLNSCLTGASYVHFRGLGRAVLRLSTAPSFGTYRAMLEFDTKTGFSVSGIEFDSSVIVTFTGGYRDFCAVDCTNFTVTGNTFLAAGAATACLGSSNYEISRNRITIDPSDGTAKHDGIIDNWEGSHDFIIADNTIDGDGIGRYGILITGMATDETAAACYNFVVANNIIKDMKFVGIWVNGRNGVNYRFSIKDNIVDGVADFYGIGIMDVYDFTVTGNKTNNTYAQGIILSREGTYGTYGARDGFIAFNSVRDANIGAAASGSSSSWAISSGHADNSKLTFRDNKVRGTTHGFAMGILGSDNKICGIDFDLGTGGTVNNKSITDSGTRTERGWVAYAPTVSGVVNVSAASNTSTKYKYEDGYVKMSGKVSVTPTAAASADTQVSITLPIASNFGNTADGIGVACTTFGLIAALNADVTGDFLILRFPATNTSANVFSFEATYQVI